MCVMSVVLDQFAPGFPPNTAPANPYPWNPPHNERRYSADELRDLIEALRAALAAAETYDRITGQPDCQDPEKAELIDRVAELERRLERFERDHNNLAPAGGPGPEASNLGG